VRQRQRQHGDPGDVRQLVRGERVGGEIRLARARARPVIPVEHVVKSGRELGQGVRRPEGGQRVLAARRDGAQVVDAVDVVGVGVGEQHGVHPVDPLRHELQPQLGRGVDQEAAPARLDQRRGAHAPVARVRRRAGAAVAADLRHAERGAAAEQHQTHLRPPRP